MAHKPYSFARVFVGYAIWMGLIPPACIYIGSTQFGWHLGVGEPVYVPQQLAALVSLAYYAFLLASFMAAVFLMRWMAPTYGASTDSGIHASLLVTVGAPLMLGGLAHLYPQISINLMLLVPAMMWSAFLLYIGLPKILRIDADRGMLMATSLLGIFFVATNGLMILTMMLWIQGFGPEIGMNWRLSVSG